MLVVCCLVGNKTDLQSLRQVSALEAAAVAEKYGIAFFETSALANNGRTTSLSDLHSCHLYDVQYSFYMCYVVLITRTFASHWLYCEL